MTKDELCAMLKENLTLEVFGSPSSTVDGEATLDITVYVYFDGQLICEATS